MKRKLVILGVMLGVLGAGSLLLVLLGGGEKATGGARMIEVEQAVTPDGRVELLVTVPTEINVPETVVGGGEVVGFECLDAEDEVVLRSEQTWPLSSDGEPPAPHVHQPAAQEELNRVARCRFEGTDPKLEGRVGLSR